MKTMTCRQMGGPCNASIQGTTPEGMMSIGKEHLFSMDDEGHKKVIAMMQEMKNNPEVNKEWEYKFKNDFDALAENKDFCYEQVKSLENRVFGTHSGCIGRYYYLSC